MDDKPLLPGGEAVTPEVGAIGPLNLPPPPSPPPPPLLPTSTTSTSTSGTVPVASAPPAPPAPLQLSTQQLALPLTAQGLQQQVATMHPYHPGYVPSTNVPAVSPPQYQYDPLAAMAALSAPTSTSLTTPMPGKKCAHATFKEKRLFY